MTDHGAMASRPHTRRGAIRWGAALWLAAGALLFACIMAATALYLSRALPRAVQSVPGDAIETASWVASDAGGQEGSPGLKPLASREPLQVRVYLTQDGCSLRAQEMDPRFGQSPNERLRFLLDQLLSGVPAPGLAPTVPRGVALRGAYILENRAVVDLGAAIAEQPLGGAMSELLCIYAIVNTVVENLPGVEEVQLLIDGKRRRTLWGEADIYSPLANHPALIMR